MNKNSPLSKAICYCRKLRLRSEVDGQGPRLISLLRHRFFLSGKTLIGGC